MLLEMLLFVMFVGLTFVLSCAHWIGFGRVEKWGIGIAVIRITTLVGANQWLIDHPLWDNPKGLNPDDFDQTLEHLFLIVNHSHVAFWTVIGSAFVIIAGSAVRIWKNRERLFPFLNRDENSESPCT